MFVRRTPGPEKLRDLWSTACRSPLSYREVGATAGGELPYGYNHDRYEITLDGGPDPFSTAVDALRRWEMHTRSGLSVFPDGVSLAVDQTILVIIRQGPVATIAPCRVVSLIDEVDRFGFAYGTLPGHPEQGEEAFVVERGDDGVVRFAVTAFSRPRGWLVRLGGPLSRRIQKRATAAYLDAMRHLAAPS